MNLLRFHHRKLIVLSITIILMMFIIHQIGSQGQHTDSVSVQSRIKISKEFDISNDLIKKSVPIVKQNRLHQVLVDITNVSIVMVAKCLLFHMSKVLDFNFLCSYMYSHGNKFLATLHTLIYDI